MPRQSSRGRSASRPAPRSPPHARQSASRPAPRARRSASPRTPPRETFHTYTREDSFASPPAPVQDGGGFFANLFKGVAFGIGNAIGGAVMSPRVVQDKTVDGSSYSSTPSVASNSGAPSVASNPGAPSVASNPGDSDACNVQSKSFQDCLNQSESDISKCQIFFNKLQECRRSIPFG